LLSEFELSSASSGRRGSARKGAASARPEEAVRFEQEFPSASWLSARVFRELEEVGALIEGLVASIAQRYGLSHAALNALAVIEGNGGPIPVGEVSARMHITSGTMTGVLDTLERRNFVVRQSDPGDRRRVLVDVTADAQAVLNRLLPEVVETATRALSGIDDRELEEILSALARLRAAIATTSAEAPSDAVRNTPDSIKRIN
jgi:DNA-binding MarR family transcriptional regulator